MNTPAIFEKDLTQTAPQKVVQRIAEPAPTSTTHGPLEEAEIAVLGGVLFEGDKPLPSVAVATAREHLTNGEEFSYPRHRRIYAAMIHLADRGEPINLSTLASEIQKRGGDGGGELNYLAEIMERVGTAAMVESCAKIVKEAAMKRRARTALLEAAERIKAGAEIDEVAADGLRAFEEIRAASRPAADRWPDPEPIPDTLLPVPPFPLDLLPESFGAWVGDISERMQCPPDYLAAASVVMLSGALGRRVSIFPKANDSWREPPNLWGCIIGTPGMLKSPSMREAFRPLKRLEEAAREKHAGELKAHETDKVIFDAERAALKAKLAKSFNSGGAESVDGIKAELIALEQRQESSIPAERRHLVHDATVEKLGVLLQANPKGLLVYRDELAGWLANMEKQGHESDRTFYIESWAGQGSFVFDRIGRERTVIPHVCLSLFGTIQPGRLLAYLQEALGGYHDDGLFQRLQVMVYPDEPKTWRNIDRIPNRTAEEAVSRIVDKLDSSTPQEMGAVPVDGEPDTFALRFSPPAQELFNAWRGDLESMVRQPDEHEAIRGHFSKYRSLMPSLALIFHLVDVAEGRTEAGPVSLEAAQKAAGWTAYLAEHARRVYGMGLQAGMSAARMLAQKIQRGDLGAEFTERDVYRKGWTSLNDPERVRRACETLAGFKGWIQAVDVPAGIGGGRPTKIYHVNPKAWRITP